MKKVYQYEVGILLDKDDEEYEAYACVWDKKYGYYDEDWGIELSLEEAKKYVQEYVEDGVNTTYGIVSEIEVSDEEYEEYEENIKENGYCETSNFDFEFSLKNVVYSLCKEKENFINKGGK